jgi:hypothetical protein
MTLYVCVREIILVARFRPRRSISKSLSGNSHPRPHTTGSDTEKSPDPKNGNNRNGFDPSPKHGVVKIWMRLQAQKCIACDARAPLFAKRDDCDSMGSVALMYYILIPHSQTHSSSIGFICVTPMMIAGVNRAEDAHTHTRRTVRAQIALPRSE